MSLCLLIQREDVIYMAGDSREAIKIDGQHYATGRHVKKIQKIGNQVIFGTGSSIVVTEAIEEYKCSGDRTIENLKSIMNKRVDQFKRQHGSDVLSGISDIAAFLVSSFQDGKTTVHGVSSKGTDTFSSIGESLRAADGARCKEALVLLKQCLNENMSVIEAFRYVYNSLSCEIIGGTLTIYQINNSGIKKIALPIIDSRKINMFVLSDAMCTRENGLIIERDDHSSKVTMNSDEMTWEVNGERKLYYDAIANKLMFGGTLEAADGVFSGSLSAATGTFAGALQAATGTFSGDLTAAGGTFTGDLLGANGTFSGELVAATGTFSGNLSAAGGTFTGTLQGVDGTFSGTITASSLQGGTIDGAMITGGSITGATIQTASSGNYVRMQSGFANLAIFSSDVNVFQINGSGGNTSIWNPSSGGIETDSGDSWYFKGSNFFLGYTEFDGGVYFSPSASVSGLTRAVNLTYDGTTKNLKLWDASGSLLATVNISGS